jgi:VIT1/CCC1 family predicted Fe2+/Mn2+ transporter
MSILPYIEHWMVECIGSAIGVVAYRFCPHRHHRWIVWVVLSIITTVITVQLVG